MHLWSAKAPQFGTCASDHASEHAWHHADGQLQLLITNGGQVMPSFGVKLTNDEIIAVIRYFQTWWTQNQLDSQQSLSEQDPLK